MKFNSFNSEILFIIAAYKERFDKCNSYVSLKKSYLNIVTSNKLNIYIADNTDMPEWDYSDLKEADNRINLHYFKFNNPGLSFVYNRGAEFAQNNQIPWLVLLDQDTILPLDFYEKYIQAVQEQNTIKIKVPCILIDNNRILSPSKYKGYRSYLYNNLEEGIYSLNENSFINTGMLVNTEFFLKVGGYNENIKLDFTDHDFVHKCKQYAEEFEVMDVTLIQDLSSITNNKDQALKRYSLYLRDLKEFKKNKKKQIMLLLNADFLRLLKLSIQYKSFQFLKLRLKK